MFEYRLGLALGKTREEIRTMPAQEFYEWQLFYMLEPFGWHDREDRTASIMTMLYNTNVDKKSKAKKPSDFIRDMPKLVVNAIKSELNKRKAEQKFENMTAAEKKRYIAQFFGGMNVRIIDEDGDSRDN